MKLSGLFRAHPTFAQLTAARRQLIAATGDVELLPQETATWVALMAQDPRTIRDVATVIARVRSGADHDSPEKDHLPGLPLQDRSSGPYTG